MAEQRVLGGRYRVVRHLARGGMAEVYLAHDELLSRTVAVKVLFQEMAQDEQFVERFRREARAAASLNHHNIVSVYDFGEDDGSWFIVMEYVDGPTLRDIIRSDGPMDPAKAAEIAGEVAAALSAAHAQGIVHRDVKPANVLITGDGGTVKVADFGIARAANVRQELTSPGTVLGTATYLSPEQAQGMPVDQRTDIYSLGMVLYEMLAGRPPFIGDSPVAVAYQSVRDTPPAPSTHNPLVPPALDAVVMKAMAKDPAARHRSAEELRSELLAADRDAGDPDATSAIAPLDAGEATAVVAGPSTSIMSTADVPEPAEPVRRPPAGPVPAAVFRRRRAAVIAGLAVLAVLLIAVLAANGGDKGGAGTVAVPNVVGQAVADARTTLETAGLKAKVTEEERPGTAGQVAAQSPTEGAQVAKGSTVELFVPRPASSTTAQTTPATQATTPTTQASTTTAAPTTTQAPSTTAAPTTVAPTTTVPVTTTVAVTTSRP